MRFWRRETERLSGRVDTLGQSGFSADELPFRNFLELKANMLRLEAQVNMLEAAVIEEQRRTPVPVIQIPSDLLHHAWTILLPAERMAVISGRWIGHALMLTTTFDVTAEGPETNCTHVQADSHRLRTALLALERSGAHLAGWIHSHPGRGAGATQPSPIDRAQHGAWVRDYSENLVSLIVVSDGVVRLWGRAIEERMVRVGIIGSGITRLPECPNVYQLDR